MRLSSRTICMYANSGLDDTLTPYVDIDPVQIPLKKHLGPLATIPDALENIKLLTNLEGWPENQYQIFFKALMCGTNE